MQQLWRERRAVARIGAQPETGLWRRTCQVVDLPCAPEQVIWLATAGSDRRSVGPAIIGAAVLILGGVGFWVTNRGGGLPEGARQDVVKPASAPDMSRPDAASVAASAPVAVASPAASAVTRSVPSWQTVLQPAVVAATRIDSLAAYQTQMEHWSCEGERCVANLRIPPTVPGGGDMSSASDVFNALQKKMALAGVDVSLSSIHPEPQGIAIALQFTPSAAAPGRFYTNAEIASIRLEMLEQGMKQHCEAPVPATH